MLNIYVLLWYKGITFLWIYTIEQSLPVFMSICFSHLTLANMVIKFVYLAESIDFFSGTVLLI